MMSLKSPTCGLFRSSSISTALAQAMTQNPAGSRVSVRCYTIEGNDPRIFALANCVSGHALLVRRTVVERALPLPAGAFHDAWIASRRAALFAMKLTLPAANRRHAPDYLRRLKGWVAGQLSRWSRACAAGRTAPR